MESRRQSAAPRWWEENLVDEPSCRGCVTASLQGDKRWASVVLRVQFLKAGVPNFTQFQHPHRRMAIPDIG
jgi:hypothetical protein